MDASKNRGFAKDSLCWCQKLPFELLRDLGAGEARRPVPYKMYGKYYILVLLLGEIERMTDLL